VRQLQETSTLPAPGAQPDRTTRSGRRARACVQAEKNYRAAGASTDACSRSCDDGAARAGANDGSSQQRGAARIGGAVDMVQMISISTDK
jgi:hypothetical protein